MAELLSRVSVSLTTCWRITRLPFAADLRSLTARIYSRQIQSELQFLSAVERLTQTNPTYPIPFSAIYAESAVR